ncbi:carbohydrate ABC transporter permease, partial [Kribbella sp. NPDC002412]
MKGKLVDLVLVVAGLLMIAPLVWLIVNALSEPIDAFQLPPRWIPRPPTLENFQQVPDLIPFAQMAWNSLQIAVITTAGSLLTSALAAYAFSRLR